MPYPAPVPRVSVALAALLAASAGCTMTSLTARNARVPVIVGPVACIDCAPAPAADGQAAPIADTVTHRNGYLALPYGQIEFGDPAVPQLNIESAAWDPCTAEIQVAKVDLHSFAVSAFVFGEVKQTVDVTARVLPVPPGACAAAATLGGAP
jgi:hypothetical protein